MAKGCEYSIAALKRAEARRQAVLDWLWANGNAKFCDIFPALNAEQIKQGLAEYPMPAMRGTLASMLQKGELAATGPRKEQTFVPLVKTTEPAEAMRQRKLERNRKFCEGRVRDRSNDATKAKRAELDREEVRKLNIKEHARIHEPWKTINFAGDTPQAKDSHGQGALREKATVRFTPSIYY